MDFQPVSSQPRGAGCRGEERGGEERRVGETRSWGGPGVGLTEPPTEAE